MATAFNPAVDLIPLDDDTGTDFDPARDLTPLDTSSARFDPARDLIPIDSAPASASLSSGFDASLGLPPLRGLDDIAIGGLEGTEAVQFDQQTGKVVPILRALPVAPRQRLALDTQGVDPHQTRAEYEGDLAIDDEMLTRAKAAASNVEPNAGDYIRQAITGLGTGAARSVAGTLEAAGYASNLLGNIDPEIAALDEAMKRRELEQNPLYALGRRVRRNAEAVSIVDPELEKTRRYSEMAGQLAADVAGAGKAAAALRTVGPRLARYGGAATQFGAQGVAQGVETAREMGASEADTLQSALAQGTIGAATAGLGATPRWLGRLSGHIGKKPVQVAADALIDGGLEAFQEVVQTGLSAYADKQILDKDRDLAAELHASMRDGGIMGVAASLVFSALGGRGGAATIEPPRSEDADRAQIDAEIARWREPRIEREPIARPQPEVSEANTPTPAAQTVTSPVPFDAPEVEPEIMRQTTREYERELERDEEIEALNAEMARRTRRMPASEPEPAPLDEERARREYQAELEAEARGYETGQGDELLAAIASAGGLPSLNSEKVGPYAGELRNTLEMSRGGKHVGVQGHFSGRLFRKDAPDMDELATRLRDRGFTFETPNDLFNALDQRFRTGRKLYGQPQRAAVETPFNRQRQRLNRPHAAEAGDRRRVDTRTGFTYALADEIRNSAQPSTSLEDRTATLSLARAIERDPARRAYRRDNARLEPVTFPPHTAADYQITGAELIVRAHGHHPIWYRNVSGETINGAIIGKNVFLNVDGTLDPLVNTAAHEITHAMEREAPDLYAELERVIERESRGNREAYMANRERRGYDRKELRRELVADFVGETMEDPRQVIEMLRDNPNLLQRLITFIDEIIRRIKRSLLKLEPDNFAPAARDTIRNLEVAERAMHEAFRQYRQRIESGEIESEGSNTAARRQMLARSENGNLAAYRALASKRDDKTITAAESRRLEEIERELGQFFLPMGDEAAAAPRRTTATAPQFRGASIGEDVDGGLDLGLFEDEAGQQAFFKRDELSAEDAVLRGPIISGRATRFFYEGARDVFDRTPGLKFLGDAIRKHVDQTRKYDGEMSYPYRAWERKHDRKARRQALSDFESYWGEHAVRAENADKFLSTYPEASKELIQLWRDTAKYADERNAGMTVYDDALKAYRPIGSVKDYFPRTIRPAVWDMLERASKAKDKAEWDNLVADLIAEGTVKSETEAVSYLDRALKPLRRFNYLGNIEAARGLPLPNRAYDYSFAAARRYMRAWAERRAQVEAFGQRIGKSGKDLFDIAAEKTHHRTTREYILDVQKRAYNEVPNNLAQRAAAFLNTLATPLHLANPKTLQRNVISGLVYNQTTFGTGNALRAAWEMRKAHQAIDEAYERGVLNDDLMNMLHDAEQLGSKALSKLQRGSDRVFRMTGYRLSEDFVRAHAMLTAKTFLRHAVKAFDANPQSRKALQFAAFLKRNGHNIAKLAAERGEGDLTDRFLRESVNLAQGGYRYDQVPLFTDTPVGRFLFKYQKWGTMATRNFMRNVLEPVVRGTELTFVRSDGERVTVNVREFQPLTRYLIALLLSGQAILGLEELMFGTTPGFASIEEIVKTWDVDKKRAMEIALGRAWKGILAVGGLGIIGNYTQHFMDVTERRRAHNPMTPPALGSILGTFELGASIKEQGEVTARDLEQFVNTQLSVYRTTKDIAARIGDTTGVATQWQRNESADHDVRWLNTITRRYADEVGEPAKRTAPGRTAKTSRTPSDESLRDALLIGDVQGVRSLLREQLRELPPGQREAFLKSVKASVRARQPIRVGSASEERRTLFLKWARERLPKEELRRVSRIDATYRKTAQAAGLMPSESKPVDLEEAMRKQRLRRALSE